jgi:hypothetical protein
MKKWLPYICSNILTGLGVFSICLAEKTFLNGYLHFIFLIISTLLLTFPAFEFWLAILNKKK